MHRIEQNIYSIILGNYRDFRESFTKIDRVAFVLRPCDKKMHLNKMNFLGDYSDEGLYVMSTRNKLST